VIKEKLKKEIDAGKTKLKTLQAEADAAKCDFWSAVLTFGKACRDAAKLRD